MARASGTAPCSHPVDDFLPCAICDRKKPKTKTGLETLGGDVVGTVTLEQYRRLRAADPVHVVQPERTHGGGGEAA